MTITDLVWSTITFIKEYHTVVQDVSEWSFTLVARLMEPARKMSVDGIHAMDFVANTKSGLTIKFRYIKLIQ